jgi:hypothetical protein
MPQNYSIPKDGNNAAFARKKKTWMPAWGANVVLRARPARLPGGLLGRRLLAADPACEGTGRDDVDQLFDRRPELYPEKDQPVSRLGRDGDPLG